MYRFAQGARRHQNPPDNFAIDVDALDKKGFHCQNSLRAVIAFIEANYKPLVTAEDRYHKKLPNI
jgi:hypothetical protein